MEYYNLSHFIIFISHTRRTKI